MYTHTLKSCVVFQIRVFYFPDIILTYVRSVVFKVQNASFKLIEFDIKDAADTGLCAFLDILRYQNSRLISGFTNCILFPIVAF